MSGRSTGQSDEPRKPGTWRNYSHPSCLFCTLSSAPSSRLGTRTTKDGERIVSGFGTSQESMHAGAIAVREAQQAISEHIRTLRGDIEQMTGGRPGDADSPVTSIHNSFDENAARIDSALARMHEALAGTHQPPEEQEPEQSPTLGA
jgi:hypothetical protein